MSDDFVLNVKQIGQYPAATSVVPKNGDVLLLQQNGAGGAYASLDPRVLFSTALLQGGFINLAPGNGIAWNGAALTWNAGSFFFSEPVQVPSLLASGNIFIGANPVATQIWVSNAISAFAQQGFVNTFNGRRGTVQLLDTDVLRAGGVLAINPHFAGVVTAPTPWNFNDNGDNVATTAFVQGAILNAASNGCIVGSFNGRGGCVVLSADDITAALTVPGVYAMANTPPSGDTSKRIATTMFVDDAMAGLKTELESDLTNIANTLDQKYAPLDSPQLTGIPTAPTAAQTINSGQIATTAFVHAAVTASTTGVSSFNTRTGAVTLTTADVTGAGGAPLAAPAFTGNATSPTPAPGDNTTRIATCAFVQAAIAAVAAGVTSFNTRTGAVTLQTADVTAVGGALLASPAFSGTPTAPTALPSVNNTQIATTAYVTAAITALPAPVSSFNGRTGAVTFQSSDISAAGGALLASPIFTGAPTAPTASAGTSNQQLATTAFVAAAVAAGVSGVASFNGRTGAVTLTSGDITGAGGALLAGPTFTGVPSAPTAAPGTNTTQLATTAYVTAAIAASGGVASFNGRTGAVTFQASDVSAVGGALLASPAFTGSPTAPTQAPGTNSTSIASTAFVAAAIAAAPGATAGPLAIRVFTTSGSYVPTPGMTVCVAEPVGGGGGGGACGASGSYNMGGGGGGSGGYSRRRLTAAQIGASQPITIGAGGTGAAVGTANGTPGGDTYMGASFATALCAARGGSPGFSALDSGAQATGSGGAGAVTTGAVGDFVAGGDPGQNGMWMNNQTSLGQPGGGGSSVFGGGGRTQNVTASTGQVGANATNYGSGGAGAGVVIAAGAFAGGNGSPGVLVITEW